LVGRNFEINCAGYGIEGGKIPSLLFTDVVMPEMSGRELVDKVKLVQPFVKGPYTTGAQRDRAQRHVGFRHGTFDQAIQSNELAAKIRDVLVR
jgi:CheY-like chemotaxis protein